VQSEERTQETFLPRRLEDYVTENNPVRVIDVFVEELDLGGLGFAGMRPEATGRPAYHPSTMLKIYLYGYLNRIQSSRRLEHERPVLSALAPLNKSEWICGVDGLIRFHNAECDDATLKKTLPARAGWNVLVTA
jgi:hypothetical protein